MLRFVLGFVCLLCAACAGAVELAKVKGKLEKNPAEADYYQIIPYDIPKDVVLEAGGLEWLPGNKLAVCTRRGEIWILENALDNPPKNVKWTRFATGLHECLGLAYKDGWLYCTQRPEVTRLKDTNGDGVADVFETFCADWGVTGDYHEYAFQSKFDKDGNLWIVLCLTGSFSSNAKYRGWCVRVTPEGKAIPTCSGLRSPGGVGFNATGDVFFTDNQGPWNGACSLKHLQPGSFQGHPDGNKWYAVTNNVLGPEPKKPESGSRIATEADKIPEFVPPSVIYPYNKMGQSASGIDTDKSRGKFGPFTEQVFVGDQTHSTVMRTFLEKVDGQYQGACFPFLQGIGSGALPLLFLPDGSLIVGGTNRGWGSRGGKPYSLDRVVWTGKTPFEAHELRAKPDGFEITFTEAVDPETAANLESYKLQGFRYIFQASYGSPEVDQFTPVLKSAKLATDAKSVRLVVEGLKVGFIHELALPGLRSADGKPLLHNVGYYTLNKIPKE